MARTVPPLLDLRALVLSLVAAYLLLALGLKAVQTLTGGPDDTLVEVVRERFGDEG